MTLPEYEISLTPPSTLTVTYSVTTNSSSCITFSASTRVLTIPTACKTVATTTPMVFSVEYKGELSSDSTKSVS